MPAPVTRSGLRTRVRTLMRQPNTAGFISNTELDTLIDESAAALYDLLVAARGADYFSTVLAFNTAAGTDEYTLPNDFYQLLSIAISDQPGTGNNAALSTVPTSGWVEPRRFQSAELAQLRNTTGDRPAKLRYALAGAQQLSGDPTPRARIRFYPTPAGQFACQIVYLPIHTGNSSGGDVTYDAINGWESYIVGTVCARLAAMQEEDQRPWLQMAAEARDRIAGLANSRDQAQPEQVADRRGALGWYDDPRGEPSWA
jgi:hypothetical protein